MKSTNAIIMGCVFSCASTLAFSAPQYFNFVIDPAQSAVSASYSNATGFDCGWAPSLSCDYRFNYVLSGSFTLVRDLQAGFYDSVENRYYDTDGFLDIDIKASWVGAQPFGANPAWSGAPRPDINIFFDLLPYSVYMPATGAISVLDSNLFEAFHGYFNDGHFVNDDFSKCLESGAGGCLNALEGSLNASLVPLPGAGVLFLTGVSALLYGRRRASRT
jgi:hypothetical protein